jgi:hypothetical protein
VALMSGRNQRRCHGLVAERDEDVLAGGRGE